MQIAENVVRFTYDVIVEEEDLTTDEDGKPALAAEAKEQAYEQLLEGITDNSGGWYPNYTVLCMADFMAGQICSRERGHDGSHA